MSGFLAALFLRGVGWKSFLFCKGMPDGKLPGIISLAVLPATSPFIKIERTAKITFSRPLDCLYRSCHAITKMCEGSDIVTLLQNKHGIAVRSEVVFLANSFFVCFENKVVAAKCRYHHEHSGVG